MNKNLARFVAGPLAAAGLTVGALAFAAAANADDPVQAAPSLFSAHTGPALANAHHVSDFKFTRMRQQVGVAEILPDASQ